jgi:hypothetical protein
MLSWHFKMIRAKAINILKSDFILELQMKLSISQKER